MNKRRQISNTENEEVRHAPVQSDWSLSSTWFRVADYIYFFNSLKRHVSKHTIIISLVYTYSTHKTKDLVLFLLLHDWKPTSRCQNSTLISSLRPPPHLRPISGQENLLFDLFSPHKRDKIKKDNVVPCSWWCSFKRKQILIYRMEIHWELWVANLFKNSEFSNPQFSMDLHSIY